MDRTFYLGAPPLDMPNPSNASEPFAELVPEDPERIAVGLADGVIHQLFAASLNLHAALAQLGDHPAAANIQLAIRELDQSIKDIRTTVFGP